METISKKEILEAVNKLIDTSSFENEITACFNWIVGNQDGDTSLSSCNISGSFNYNTIKHLITNILTCIKNEMDINNYLVCLFIIFGVIKEELDKTKKEVETNEH